MKKRKDSLYSLPAFLTWIRITPRDKFFMFEGTIHHFTLLCVVVKIIYSPLTNLLSMGGLAKICLFKEIKVPNSRIIVKIHFIYGIHTLLLKLKLEHFFKRL